MKAKRLLLMIVVAMSMLACQLTALVQSQEQPTETVSPTVQVQATNVPPTMTVAVAVVQPTTPIQPSVTAPTQPTRAPAIPSPTTAQKPATAPTPTRTATLRATATATRANTSTSTPKPAATATLAPKAGCVSNAPQAKPSNLIKSVTLALDVTTDTNEPVSPTTTFQTNSTIHAVAGLQNAPARTELKALWFATDVGNVAPCNSPAAEPAFYTTEGNEIQVNGIVYIDFRLTPNNKWPVGTYRVEIYVNNTLDRVVNFTIK